MCEREKAGMIQHNDSDTSCMRALALLERTFASETELSPIYATTHATPCWTNVAIHHDSAVAYQSCDAIQQALDEQGTFRPSLVFPELSLL